MNIIFTINFDNYSQIKWIKYTHMQLSKGLLICQNWIESVPTGVNLIKHKFN